jgi:signal peptidase I
VKKEPSQNKVSFSPVEVGAGFPALKDFLKGIFQVLLFVFIVRTFVVSLYRIPSGSMVPSLLVGDHVVVSKFSYGFSRHSMIFGDKIPYFQDRVCFWKKPKRGDVVVVALPANPSIFYIKRVVGLPGDRIQQKQGKLYVNGIKASVKRLGYYDQGGKRYQGWLYEEKLPKGGSHALVKRFEEGLGYADNTPVYSVPMDSIFLEGDNRDGSLDSRFSHALGSVPMSYLVGKALFIAYSVDPELSWSLGNILKKIRFHRLFSSVSRIPSVSKASLVPKVVEQES